MRKLISIFAIVATASAPAADGVIFDQHYTPGNTYHQTITMEQEMDMNFGSGAAVQKTNVAMGFNATVEQHQNGKDKRVAVQYDRTVLSVNNGKEKFSYDSQSPGAANAGVLAAIGRIIGQEFVAIFDEEDNLKEIENIETTLKLLAGNDPETSQIYQQLFNRDTVKKMLQQSPLRSPKNIAIKPGESWPLRTELPLPGIGVLVVSGDYTFKKMVEHDGVQCAEVSAKAEISVENVARTPADEKAISLMQQMNLKVEQGKMEGTIFYDTAIHFPRAISMTQNVTLTAKIPNGDAMRLPMKQTIGMKLDKFGPISNVPPKSESQE